MAYEGERTLQKSWIFLSLTEIALLMILLPIYVWQ